jgi:excisionase family DNA binding protein
MKEKALPAARGALKLKDAAKYLGGVSQITLRRQIDAGKIKPNRSLRHLLIPIAELDRWLAEGQDK